MQKRHLLTLALSLTIPIVASAQSFTTQHLGSFDYYYGDDGSSAVGQRLGNFYYLNGTDACGRSYYRPTDRQFPVLGLSTLAS